MEEGNLFIPELVYKRREISKISILLVYLQVLLIYSKQVLDAWNSLAFLAFLGFFWIFRWTFIHNLVNLANSFLLGHFYFLSDLKS